MQSMKTAISLLPLVLIAGSLTPRLAALPREGVFNVTDYGATGKKDQDARHAIQKAIDTCAAAGGGTVYFPAGAYTSGEIRLRSHVRLYIDSGATLYASRDYRAFHKDRGALLFGQDLENITIEGRGTLDGQAEYEWRLSDLDDAYIRPNALLMQAMSKPLMRSFPKGFPKETYPRLVLLFRCKDVRIAGLSFIRSRSWSINPYACERVVIDGIHVQSSLKEGVWADGIDPDSCKDVRISNSTIETGDDAIVFYSSNVWGPALPCENITVTNCRLSSASSAIKFCDGNSNSVRGVTIDNVVISDSNRGLAFMVFDGGYVSDVVISNVTIQCRRFDWFFITAITTPMTPTPSSSRTPRLIAMIMATRPEDVGESADDGPPPNTGRPGRLPAGVVGPAAPGMVLFVRQNGQKAVAGGFGPVPRTRPHRPQLQV